MRWITAGPGWRGSAAEWRHGRLSGSMNGRTICPQQGRAPPQKAHPSPEAHTAPFSRSAGPAGCAPPQSSSSTQNWRSRRPGWAARPGTPAWRACACECACAYAVLCVCMHVCACANTDLGAEQTCNSYGRHPHAYMYAHVCVCVHTCVKGYIVEGHAVKGYRVEGRSKSFLHAEQQARPRRKVKLVTAQTAARCACSLRARACCLLHLPCAQGCVHMHGCVRILCGHIP